MALRRIPSPLGPPGEVSYLVFWDWIPSRMLMLTGKVNVGQLKAGLE